MNRIDELTDRLIDGTLTDAEGTELESLIGADPSARDRYLALLNVEAALRGLRTDLDLAAATVRRIEAERAERTATTVMAEIADSPAPKWSRRSSSRRWRWAVVTAIAAALLVGVWLLNPAPNNPAPPANPGVTKTDVARIRTLSGSVEILNLGESVATTADQSLVLGQTVRTVGEDSVAVLEFPDGTRLELQPDTTVRFTAVGDENGTPRKLFLVNGQLTAVVTGGRTVVGTGAADVVARNGSFSMGTSGPESVRVEPRDGDVQVVRGEPAKPMSLSPGHAAFVRDEITPIHIEPRFRIDTTPRNRLDFPGASTVAFAAEGQEVWAGSARQLVRWRIGSEGRGTGVQRELFTPPVKNDGYLAVITPDRRSLVACRVDDKEDRLVVRDLPTGDVRHMIPVRVTEPRFLCVSPDATWVATAGSKPNRTVRVWETATGRERFTYEPETSTFCMASTPDGRLLALDVTDLGRGSNNKVVFLNAATGEKAFSLPTQRRVVTALAFTTDGRFMAAGFNGAVQIWDVPGRQLVRTIEGFERGVMCLAFDPGAKLLAAGTGDGQAWLWSVETGKRVQVIETGNRGVRALAFSPDGKTIVTATNKAPVALWDVAQEPMNNSEPGS
ncbi:MAG: FecR domain-containing protein [Planctomycetes bacterium]|nr:FecR domain-containing protein [Planctomycetota bacterium]